MGGLKALTMVIWRVATKTAIVARTVMMIMRVIVFWKRRYENEGDDST